MSEEVSPAGDRLADVLGLSQRALEMLDKAVGRAARLPIRDRERVREYLLPARNHLRSSTDTLRRTLEREAARRAAPRHD